MDPFIGEIRMFGGNYAPRNWSFCDGQILIVSNNEALFSLLGNKYGGDGRTTFALPDMRGRVPVHQGQGNGLSNRIIGSRAGSELVQLSINEIPQHTHYQKASLENANNKSPASKIIGKPNENFYDNILTEALTQLNSESVENTGGNQKHQNIAPSLGVSFIISLHGNYPSRN